MKSLEEGFRRLGKCQLRESQLPEGHHFSITSNPALLALQPPLPPPPSMRGFLGPDEAKAVEIAF